MTTFGEIIDDTIIYLQGFTGFQDQSTHLTASCTNSDTTMTVANTSSLSRGIAEIGNELIWIDSVDTAASTITIPPYGRGFRNSTAVAHSSGERVISAPAVPRRQVMRALNESINSIYPNLYAVGTTSFTFNPSVSTYPLPSGSEGILQITWQTLGPSKEWMPVRRYSMDSQTNATAFPTGSSVSIYDAIVPGRTVQVTYLKQPSPLVSESDVFSTVTGLPASCEDLVRLGASYRMVMFLDIPHLQGYTAEADFASNMRPTGEAARTAKQLLQMYRVRLEEEVAKQQSLYPTRSHYTR